MHKGPVYWVDFDPEGKRVLTVSGASAFIWKIDDHQKPLAIITHGGKGKSELKCARFSPNGRWIATASTDGTAQVWDARTFRQVAKFDRHASVLCVRFSGDSGRLVVAGEDSQAVVYDTANWLSVGFPIIGPGPIFSAAFTEDDQCLVISSLLLNAVQFYEISSGRAMGDGFVIPSQATCVDYMPLDKVVVVACDDGTVRALGTPFISQDTPAWMQGFAERIVGMKTTGPDAFERVESTVEELRNYATTSAQASNADFARLVQWKMTPGSTRHGLPRFTSTVAANIALRVDERSVDALYECYDAAPGDPLVLAALSLYMPNLRLGEHLAEIVLRIPTAEPLARCFAAATLVQAGRSTEAQAVMDKALADAPNDPRVLRRVAKFQARQGNRKEAVALFGRALQLEPDDMETHRSYAWALFNFEQPAEASAHFQTAEDLAGPMNDDLIAGLCLCAVSNKNPTEARQAFRRLVALDAQWKTAAYVRELRGWTQTELHKLETVRASLFPKD